MTALIVTEAPPGGLKIVGTLVPFVLHLVRKFFTKKKNRRDLKLKYKLVVLNHSFFVLELESSPLFLIHLSKEQINIASASSGMVLWALSSIISYLSMIYCLIQFPHPPTDICFYCFIPLVNLLSIARFSLRFF